MAATITHLAGPVVAAMLTYAPKQQVTFDYAGHTLVVTRGVPTDATFPGVEYGVTELDADGEPCDPLFVLNAANKYFHGERELAVQTMFGEVLAEATTLGAALGAMLAHFER